MLLRNLINQILHSVFLVIIITIHKNKRMQYLVALFLGKTADRVLFRDVSDPFGFLSFAIYFSLMMDVHASNLARAQVMAYGSVCAATQTLVILFR